MRILLSIIISSIITINSHADINNYKNLNFIEMDVVHNDKIVGFNNFYFQNQGETFIVKNEVYFSISVLGVEVFKVKSNTEEEYKNNQLISFKSKTFQNKKEKYVRINYKEDADNFIIEGSSYNGEVSADTPLGNWWNADILKADKQISPLSGSIKKQVVSLIGDEQILLNGNLFSTSKYTIKSKNENLSDDKKLNFEIWIDKTSKIIVKVAYNRLGNWEYRMKKAN